MAKTAAAPNTPVPNDADADAKKAAQVRAVTSAVESETGDLLVRIPAAYRTLPGVVSGSGKTRVTVQAQDRVGGFTVALTVYTKDGVG